MMQVGNMATFEEDRSHFAAWCISSSPLVLGFNVSDPVRMKRVLPIIGNKEMIAVNQHWAGHPGRLVQSHNEPGFRNLWAEQCNGSDPAQGGWALQSVDAAGLAYMVAFHGISC